MVKLMGRESPADGHGAPGVAATVRVAQDDPVEGEGAAPVATAAVDRASVALLSLVIALTGVSLPIMTVALPALGDAFPTWSTADLSWVTNIFTIVGAGTLIPAGVLADRAGRKRLVLGGAAVFLVGSLVGGMAPAPGWIIAARAIQSVGASAFTPAGVALMVAAFPGERLATAMGTWAVAGGVSSAAGPGLGGIIIDGLGWRWAFWVVVPIALAVLAVGPRVLKEPATATVGSGRFPDPLAAVILMVGASSVTFALVRGPAWGWFDGRTLAWLAGGLALGAVVVMRSARRPVPLIELDLFRIRTVQLGNLGTFVFSAAWFGMFFGLVLFLTKGWGWSLLEAGMASAPIPLFAGLFGVWAGRRADTVGHRAFILPGTVVFAAAAVWFHVAMGDDASLAVFLPGAIAVGVASGLVFPSMQAVALYGVPADSRAAGSAVMFAIQRLGITFGVAAVIGLQGEAGQLGPVLWVMALGAAVSFLIGLAVDTRPTA
jgi:MFS family permease